MKILLTTLNSKYIHSNLALKYLYGVAAESGLDIELKEFTINNDRDYIFTEIVRGGYDLICFSCYIWNVDKVKELAADIKKARPQMKLMMGGPEVSFNTSGFLKENPAVDYIICGEGEKPFFEFCREIVLGRNNMSKVSGLVYRRGGEIVANYPGPPVAMDQIPFPYTVLNAPKDKVIYYESSRGCPYRCSYCLSSIDKGMRSLSAERIRRDLGYFLLKDVSQVKFIDRTFNYHRDRAYQIWNYIINNDNGVTSFHFEICADLLDERTIKLLTKARRGLFQFEIGVQSTNPEALRAVDRDESVFSILNNTRKLIDAGNIHIHVDLIAGLPHESYNSFKRSFNMVYALGADNLQLGFLKLLRGTKLRSEAAAYGYEFRDKAPYEIISSNYLSAVDVVKLKMVEHVLDLYYNRGGFERTLKYIITAVATDAFNFFEQLADFFYYSGYQHKSHKKEDLYRIIMKFAEERGGEIAEKTGELLKEDLADTMNVDAVKKFHRKGWGFNG